MDPLFFFGIGVALAGCGSIGTTLAACREILTIPRGPGALGTSALLAAMLFILLVGCGIVAGGLWVAIAVAGGANG
ncbi:hypothetical protein [Sphingomonas sp. Leaf25]|uniref:hypothetical protein n=1 Tax=Sphingomonas sp. Leaf25 TaxID=1735692 RepID=UPI0006F962FB|nr:hypothetical protein [Sphingomonas sp. Leaf25]KQN06925.1 hypothetical protein ASE78_14990 [Sphingomonas sp. Leaf25]